MTLKMQVISSVEIEPISEEFMGELIRKEIAAQNPDVNVIDIEFKVSRNPTRVEAIVNAQYGDTPVTSFHQKNEVTSEEEETFPLNEEEEEEAQPASVEDIFGG